MGEIEFDFLDKSKPLNYTIRLAKNMQLFSEPEKLADIIRHQYIVEKFDPEMIQQMSNLLTDPKHVNIYIRSKSFDNKPELTNIEDLGFTRLSSLA